MSKQAQNIHHKKDEGINMSDGSDFDDDIVKDDKLDKNKLEVPNQIQLTGMSKPLTGKSKQSGREKPSIDLPQISLEMNRQSIQEPPYEDDIQLQNASNEDVQQATVGDYFEDEVVVESKHQSAVSNMKLFQKNYGITFEMPSIYVLDSIFYPINPKYSLQVVIQVVPQSESYKVVNHYLNTSDAKQNNLNALKTIKMNQTSEYAMLRLVKLQNYKTVIIQQIELKQCKKAIIKFSEDGKFFCIYQNEDRHLRIFDSSKSMEIESFLNNVEHDKSISEFIGEDKTKEDISFIDKCIFDKNNRFIVGYGKEKVFVYNFTKEQLNSLRFQIFKIKIVFESIHAVRLISQNNTKYRCMVACKKFDKRQISIYDIFEHHKCGDDDKHVDGGHDDKNQIDLIYYNDMTKESKVEISLDLQKIVFVNGEENYIFEKRDKQLFQNNVTQIRNQKVWKIDPYLDSFIFVISDEYDNQLQIVSIAEDQKFSLTIPKHFEPGRIQIFDANFKTGEVNKGFINSDTSTSDNLARLVILNDDELVIHQIKYKQTCHQNEQINEKKRKVTIKNFTQSVLQITKFQNNSIKAFSFNWPYFSFSAIENGYIMIINCYDSKQIHRVQICENEEQVQIVDTFISDSNDLFVVVQNKSDSKIIRYQLYVLDLDRSNLREQSDETYVEAKKSQFQFKHLYTYTSEDVDDQNLIRIFVRGSSVKESVDFNHKLIVFFIHSNYIYTWINSTDKEADYFIQGNTADKRKPVVLWNEATNKVFTHTKYIFNNNSQSFYFLSTEEKLQQVMKVDISFSTYEIKTIHSHKITAEEIETFSLDRIKNYFIFLYKSVSGDDESNNRRFKIFDFNQESFIYEQNIKDRHLIGRLKSGLFDIVDGHIYFNNSVIKIRYDMILSKNHYSEDQIFNYYDDIFSIKDKNLQVKSKTPFNSLRGHRFSYIISDQLHYQTKQLFILPYLHERKLYLHRNKFNIDYFYTTIETLFEEDKDFRQKDPNGDRRYSSIGTKLKKMDNSYVSIGAYQNTQQPMTIQAQREFSSKEYHEEHFIDGDENFGKSILQKQREKKTFTNIIVMNQSEYKYYVYTLNGLLQNRVDFSEEIQYYGYPIAVSDNGQNYIFKRRDELCKTVEEQMTVSVLHLTAFGMMRLKEINIFDQLKVHLAEIAISDLTLSKQKQAKREQRYKDLKKDMENLVDWKPDEERKKLEEIQLMRFDYQVNDKLDICIRIKPSQLKTLIGNAFKTSTKIIHHHDEKQEKTIYYFEAGSHTNKDKNALMQYTPRNEWPQSMLLTLEILERSDLNDKKHKGAHNKSQNIFVQDEKPSFKFLMNNRYLFFYDLHEIKMLDSRDDYHDNVIKSLNFSIRDRDHKSHIKSVQTGSNQNIISITVDQTEGQNTIFSWNVFEDAEYEAYDVGTVFDTVWDNKGIPVILTEKNVILSKERCNVKVFDTKENLIKILNRNSYKEFPLSKGHRFDNDGHNWILMREYLGLSFSYMTFVIKAKIESGKMKLPKKGNFDFEPYNYILNRSTCFLKKEFIENGFQELKTIFKRWLEVEKGLLDLITYPQYVREGDKKNGNIYINTPLYIAVNNNSMRTVDLILKTMAEVDQNSSVNFRSIFPQLIQYESFQDYLTNLPVQTKQMTYKQILKTKKAMTKDIVKMTHSSSVQIDNQFYINEMGEDNTENSSQRSFPVEVKAMRIDWFLQEDDGKKFLESLLEYKDLRYYKINTIQMIIEYLFNRFRYVILLTVFPIYLLQVTFFSLTLLQYQHREKMTTEHIKRTLMWSQANLWINIVSLTYNLIVFFYMPRTFFKRLITWNDLIFGAINIVLNTFILADNRLGAENYKTDETNKGAGTIRLFLTAGIIVIFLKLLYFLSLIEAVAPLINMIKQIIFDIRWFSFVCGIFIYSISLSFYIIGQNQIQFDNIESDNIENMAYNTQWGAVGYVWDIIIGQQNIAQFSYGKPKANYVQILWVLFTIAVFILFILFLNMLVAIMGNTFNTRIIIQDEILIQDHLFFVVDNWHLLKIAFLGKTKSVKYIITAFFKEDEDDENQEMINVLDNQLDQIDLAQRQIATSLQNIVGKLDVDDQD